MKVLYVTSFIPAMYPISAKDMIRSFASTKSEGRMLICHEGYNKKSIPGFPAKRLLLWNLDESAWLKDWLGRNADIIPVALGGKAGRCDCSYPDNPQKNHKPKCPGWWWNKNASRWFRKIVCLRYAIENYSFDEIIWVDCDVKFLKKLKEETVHSWFTGKDVFFLQNKRRHPETGVVGYNMLGKGRELIEIIADWYDSGRFREEPRWDDCWQLMKVLEKHQEISRIDLASGVAARSQVIPTSPLRGYFIHTKGRHKRAKVI